MLSSLERICWILSADTVGTGAELHDDGRCPVEDQVPDQGRGLMVDMDMMNLTTLHDGRAGVDPIHLYALHGRPIVAWVDAGKYGDRSAPYHHHGAGRKIHTQSPWLTALRKMQRASTT